MTDREVLQVLIEAREQHAQALKKSAFKCDDIVGKNWSVIQILHGLMKLQDIPRPHRFTIEKCVMMLDSFKDAAQEERAVALNELEKTRQEIAALRDQLNTSMATMSLSISNLTAALFDDGKKSPEYEPFTTYKADQLPQQPIVPPEQQQPIVPPEPLQQSIVPLEQPQQAGEEEEYDPVAPQMKPKPKKKRRRY